MICFMWYMKGIWIVNSRTVFERSRRCKICWLSTVIMYLIVSSCCVTHMLTATENTGVCFGITGIGSSLSCPSVECKNHFPQQGNLKLAPHNTSNSPVFTRCSWWFLLNWCLVTNVKCWLIQHFSIFEAEQLFFNYRKMLTSYAIWIEGRIPYLHSAAFCAYGNM